MISNPNLLFYVCIAKGPTILADFSSKEPGIESLASQCIEKTPPHHSMFSHTVRKRTHTFLIDDYLAYFAICDENLEKSVCLWFLNRVKCAFQDLIESGSIEVLDNLTSHRFQSQFDLIFGEIMALDLDLMGSPRSVAGESRNPSLDVSSRGKRISMASLLALKKKNGLPVETNGDAFSKDAVALAGARPAAEKKVDLCGDNLNDVYSRDMKNGLLHGGDRHPQKAKQIWRKHVWVVLILDLFVCAVLFGIWLWVCRGFQCVDG